MSVGLAFDPESADPEDIGRAAVKVTRNRSERSTASFILVFEFEICALCKALENKG